MPVIATLRELFLRFRVGAAVRSREFEVLRRAHRLVASGRCPRCDRRGVRTWTDGTLWSARCAECDWTLVLGNPIAGSTSTIGRDPMDPIVAAVDREVPRPWAGEPDVVEDAFLGDVRRRARERSGPRFEEAAPEERAAALRRISEPEGATIVHAPSRERPGRAVCGARLGDDAPRVGRFCRACKRLGTVLA